MFRRMLRRVLLTRTQRAVTEGISEIERSYMTRGIKTSEFWVTVVTVILSLLGEAGALPADFPHEAFLVVATYILSRGLAKYLAARAGSN